jgi:hypothetical protein
MYIVLRLKRSHTGTTLCDLQNQQLTALAMKTNEKSIREGSVMSGAPEQLESLQLPSGQENN